MDRVGLFVAGDPSNGGKANTVLHLCKPLGFCGSLIIGQLVVALQDFGDERMLVVTRPIDGQGVQDLPRRETDLLDRQLVS